MAPAAWRLVMHHGLEGLTVERTQPAGEHHDGRRQLSEHAEAEPREEVNRERLERGRESGLTARERQERWPIG
jgi:hypothetical protein